MPRNPDSPAMRWFRPALLVIILLVAGLTYWFWGRGDAADDVAAPEEAGEALEPWDQPASRPVPELEADESADRADEIRQPGEPAATPVREKADQEQVDQERAEREPLEDTLNRPGPAAGPTIPREVLREQMSALRPSVRACYEALLDEFPDASGQLTISFDIGVESGRGHVELAEIDAESTTVFDARLHDCVLESMGELEFEAGGPDGAMRVTYPFHFQRPGAGESEAEGER